jgi:proline racemase
MITGNPVSKHAHGRNTVVISTGDFDWEKPSSWTGALDRSACGTGTSARMAILNAKGKLGLNRDYVHESILGTTFIGRLIRKTKVGPYNAVIPTISGQAWITGIAQYLLDPTDPFPEGYRVADIWGGITD